MTSQLFKRLELTGHHLSKIPELLKGHDPSKNTCTKSVFSGMSRNAGLDSANAHKKYTLTIYSAL